jgi:hypothetical protein
LDLITSHNGAASNSNWPLEYWRAFQRWDNC